MDKVTKLNYKNCIVPSCRNTTVTAPEKIYFLMPRDANVRKKWCEAMKRVHGSNKSQLYCCEDHFNIEKDVENYMEYRIMTLEKGQKTKLRLRKDVVPYIFQCPIKDKLHPSPDKKDALKRIKQALVQEALAEAALSESAPTETTLSEATPNDTTLLEASPCIASSITENMDVDEELFNMDNKFNGPENLPVDKAIQVNCKVRYRSKGVNVNITAKQNSIALSPFPMSCKNVCTSPLKPAQSSTAKRKLYSDTPSNTVSITNSPSSVLSTDYELESEGSSCESNWHIEDESDNDLQFKSQMRSATILSIERQPKMFVGLPKKSFFLVKLLSENIPLSSIDILITLRKIKLNESFSILAVNFGYSQSTISRIFSKSIVIISKKMKELIVWPTPSEIFKNLPISFRARYANVVSIIDCLEIQIEKPTNAVHQSLTWSQYKKCNTLKYLISSTPDGLVSYISDGYGGRATDVIIVEDSGFLEFLPPQKAIMANRGFKDLTRLLENKNCTLVRPPSVSLSTASSKEDVKQSKQIAALRIHIERVISRLREFNLLLPHACVDHNLIPVMDEVIIVACGLINLQDVLIKK